jgi:hypothetical protein
MIVSRAQAQASQLQKLSEAKRLALLLKFNKMVESRLLTVGVPQLEDVFNILHKNLPT